MTFDEYQKLAIKTINTKLTFQERLDMLSLGLRGESGEVADIVKKWRYHHDHTGLDEVKLSKEVGDCAWYVSGVAETLGSTLSVAVGRAINRFCKDENWISFDPNNIASFQKLVEECLMAPPEERGDRPEQISEIAHGLCISCNSLAETVRDCAQDLEVYPTLTEERMYNVQEEIVSVLADCAIFAVILGRPLEAILSENIEKLRARYGEAFSAERSLNRLPET